MAPMTRLRGGRTGTPTSLNATYYAQRASAGLIITGSNGYLGPSHGLRGGAGRLVGRAGRGMAARHAAPCTNAAGRSSCSCGTRAGSRTHRCSPEGALPVAPSAIAAQGRRRHVDRPSSHSSTPRALRPRGDSRHRAAVRAGGAQCTRGRLRRRRDTRRERVSRRSSSCAMAPNHRTNAYGGTPANRARLLFEMVEAGRRRMGPGDRVGVRVSPIGTNSSMSDSDPMTNLPRGRRRDSTDSVSRFSRCARIARRQRHATHDPHDLPRAARC